MNHTRSLLFPLHGFVGWNGGIDLARVLSTAILHPDVTHRFVINFAFPQPTIAQRFLNTVLRRWRLTLARGRGKTAAGSPAALQRAAREIVLGHEVIACNATAPGILKAALTAQADIVFPTMLPLGPAHLARVGYLFDFQHCHMPQLFPKRIRKNRDARFARIAADANAIIVNSKAAANDATAFLGIPAERILIIPYTPHAHAWWFDGDPVETRQRYGIKSCYLLVSNHFWKHKDHATALRAFEIMREQHSDMNLELVLTGDPIDHREPRHYGDLITLSERLGIAAHVHFLGLIPKRDQLALLRGCMALMQPTQFEGGPGGGAVYEAIGLGVPVIVSDIPVNLEIDQGDVRFFRMGDAEDLAARTTEALSQRSPRPDREVLLAKGNTNLARLGNAICNYLVQVLDRDS